MTVALAVRSKHSSAASVKTTLGRSSSTPPSPCSDHYASVNSTPAFKICSLCSDRKSPLSGFCYLYLVLFYSTCRDVVLPKLSDAEKAGLPPEFCVRCDCKYENRNTTIIKVVVIIVIWIISLLVVYMLFLICLDPLLNKRVQSNYTEHTNEDEMSGGEGVSHAMGVRSNVLNRVGHQQDKWKRQVREQRRNIYDRHTMLN